MFRFACFRFMLAYLKVLPLSYRYSPSLSMEFRRIFFTIFWSLAYAWCTLLVSQMLNGLWSYFWPCSVSVTNTSLYAITCFVWKCVKMWMFLLIWLFACFRQKHDRCCKCNDTSIYFVSISTDPAYTRNGDDQLLGWICSHFGAIHLAVGKWHA